MTATFAFVLVLVIFALIFDYINGFHDAANSIATVVSTRVLSPGIAAYGGISGLLKTDVWVRTIKFIVLSPLIGMILGFVLMVAVHWIFRRFTPKRVDNIFRKGQLFSAAAFSLGHGGNDAQKTMGIITAVLTAGGVAGLTYGPKGALPGIPIWVVLSAHAAIALGTLSGGWRIVHTMGSKITKLKPVGGFCAETGAALTLAYVTLTGTPVSTTHTITGTVVGVGATRRLSAVKWGVASRIVWAWILTIPAAGLIAALSFWLVRLLVHLAS